MKNWLVGAAFLCAVGLGFATPVSAQTENANRFADNADGLNLNEVLGHTLVGVTRDSSKTWSVYLSPSKEAQFHFSSGAKKTATWRKASANIICFKGLVDSDPSAEVCKLAKPKGRGLDWLTVNVTVKDGQVFYDRADRSETHGSSQIVYAYTGSSFVRRNSFVSDLHGWAGRVIVARGLSSKKPWFMWLKPDGQITHVTMSGKQINGTYRTYKRQICLKMPASSNLSGCWTPKVSGGKIRWTQDGKRSVSEIVYLSPPFKGKSPKVSAALPKISDAPIAHFAKDRVFNVVETTGDGQLVAGLDKSGRVSVLSVGTQMDLLPKPISMKSAQPGASVIGIDHMAFSRSGVTLAYSSGDALAIFRKSDPVRHDAILPMRDAGAATKIRAIELDLMGNTIAVASYDRVRLISTITSEEIWTQQVMFPGTVALKVSNDGRTLLAGSSKGELTLLDAASGDVLKTGSLYGRGTPPGPEDNSYWISNLAFSKDDKTILASTFGGHLMGFTQSALSLSQTYERRFKGVHDLATFRRKGQHLVAVALKDERARILDAATGKDVLVFGGPSHSAIEIEVVDAEKGLLLISAKIAKGFELWAMDTKGAAAAKTLKQDWAAFIAIDATRLPAAYAAANQSRETRLAAAKDDYTNGRCEALSARGPWYAAYAQNSSESGNGVSCEAMKAKRVQDNLEKDIMKAIVGQECRYANRLAKGLEDLRFFDGVEVSDLCAYTREMRDLSERLMADIAAARCDLVEGHMRRGFEILSETEIQKPPERIVTEFGEELAEICDTSYLMTRATAQEMYLAAATKSVDGDVAKALAIYRQLMKRYPADDLATKAADRLINLSDANPDVKPDETLEMAELDEEGMNAIVTYAFVRLFSAALVPLE